MAVTISKGTYVYSELSWYKMLTFSLERNRNRIAYTEIFVSIIDGLGGK